MLHKRIQSNKLKVKYHLCDQAENYLVNIQVRNQVRKQVESQLVIQIKEHVEEPVWIRIINYIYPKFRKVYAI